MQTSSAGPCTGQIFRSLHLNAVERVGEQKQTKTNHEIRQDGEDVPRGRKRDDGHHQKDLVRLHLAGTRKKCKQAGPEKDSRKGQDIGGGNDPPLGVLTRMGLQVGLQGDDENPAAEAEEEMAHEHLDDRVVAQEEIDSEYAETHGTNGNKAQLHLVAGKLAGYKRTEPDADGNGGGQVADSGSNTSPLPLPLFLGSVGLCQST